jgi:hypothetical protein
MTQREIDALPPLLKRGDVLRLTGIAERKYLDFLRASKVQIVMIPGVCDRRIVKTELLKLLHLNCSH